MGFCGEPKGAVVSRTKAGFWAVAVSGVVSDAEVIGEETEVVGEGAEAWEDGVSALGLGDWQAMMKNAKRMVRKLFFIVGRLRFVDAI